MKRNRACLCVFLSTKKYCGYIFSVDVKFLGVLTFVVAYIMVVLKMHVIHQIYLAEFFLPE